MEKKIVLLPLDERPCNALFPGKLLAGSGVQVAVPQALGDKKHPADVDGLIDFLNAQCADADGLILSMDMLLYGGLLPSRLHSLDDNVIARRLETVRALKRRNPALVIYAFQCIMRCPAYSSADEEPDYYEQYGELIHKAGAALHKSLLGLADRGEYEALCRQIPAEALADYTARRAVNLAWNKRTLALVKEGVIDFLIVPQDDSAPYGYTAMDQQQVRDEIARQRQQMKALMYPGADEVGLTLLSRMLLHFAGKTPGVYLLWAAAQAGRTVPLYEDRPLAETVKYHLMAAGCRTVDTAAEADFILALSCPVGQMVEAVDQPARTAGYCVERSLPAFVDAIAHYIRAGRAVTVCDNAYANGADLELVDLLDQMQLLDKLAGYAGWNTSANSLGTAIAQGVRAMVLGTGGGHRDFLALRYVEDALYCAVVRWAVTDEVLPGLGMNYFDVDDERGAVSEEVRCQLERFADRYLPSLRGHIFLEDVRMPWRRMFETDLTVRWEP